MNILVSACILGENCRYDGKNSKNRLLIEQLGGHNIIPVCPEVLGGLPTPRPPSEIFVGRVFSKNGRDVTDYFLAGAEKTLELAKDKKCDMAILKSKSPSCGVGLIYDGSFSGK
ncbi:MAG: DUF523 domain-containing protein, partial [Firmicutes bacterium]|nr:DUF523 domain-containing protein [Bacillota bacterium]